eukprot:4313041-Prymnesium_polylepis.1
MAQPFLPPSSNVCAKRYFQLGNLQAAADEGQMAAAVMFILAGCPYEPTPHEPRSHCATHPRAAHPRAARRALRISTPRATRLARNARRPDPAPTLPRRARHLAGPPSSRPCCTSASTTLASRTACARS